MPSPPGRDGEGALLCVTQPQQCVSGVLAALSPLLRRGRADGLTQEPYPLGYMLPLGTTGGRGSPPAQPLCTTEFCPVL